MLREPAYSQAPYCLFTVDAAFSAERLAGLEALFRADVRWVRHEDHFYECFIADVSAALDPRWLRALAHRMATLTGIELTDKVQVTIQRMEPGDHAAPHTDRPLVGYEAARLVVQLDRDWATEDGGCFRAFSGDDLVIARWPQRNSAVGFTLTAASLHDVLPTHRVRRSVVFNFWHIGNTEAVQAMVHSLFAHMDFGSLPLAVAAVADVAEVTHTETATHRASAVAIALLAWGYDPDEAAAGYLLALSPDAVCEPVDALTAAAALARWLVRLHTEDFDLDVWEQLRQRLAPHQHPRLRQPWRVAFGGPSP